MVEHMLCMYEALGLIPWPHHPEANRIERFERKQGMGWSDSTVVEGLSYLQGTQVRSLTLHMVPTTLPGLILEFRARSKP